MVCKKRLAERVCGHKKGEGDEGTNGNSDLIFVGHTASAKRSRTVKSRG